MKITWSFSALEMLADLHEYISEENEKAADKYIDGIYKSVEKLEKHPESCTPCRNNKLRQEGYLGVANLRIMSLFMNLQEKKLIF